MSRITDALRAPSLGLATVLVTVGFVLAYVGLLVTFERLAVSWAKREAETTALNALLTHRAVHKYVITVQRPEIYRLKREGLLYEDYFSPKVMSFTYIARSIKGILNEERRNVGLGGIYFKLASDNPRNPVNLADPEESALLALMNEGVVTEHRAVVSYQGEQHLFVAVPVARNDKGCMACHGEPADAPADLLRDYGAQAGFFERPNLIRALISIRVPMSEVVAEAHQVLWNLAVATFVGLLAIYVVVVAALRRLYAQNATIVCQRDQLQAASRELARSNAELSQFAYAMSHDLKAPLRMVTSYLQLIERRLGRNLDADATEFLGYAIDGGRRMSAMIDDLLEYSRVGREASALAEVDTTAAVAAALANLAPVVDETRAVVNVATLPVVVGHQPQLVRLFQNLVGNSLKYRDPARSPKISVAAEQIGGYWQFSIADNGIGIAKEHHERIFQVFQRLHADAGCEGTGIGLAVCKRIVETHGGRMWVSSTPGEGSTFYFTLPIPPGAPGTADSPSGAGLS